MPQMIGNVEKNLVYRRSSGIGEKSLRARSRKERSSFTLGLVARRAGLLDELAGKCENVGGTARAIPADVTDPSAIEEAFQQFIHEFSTIDMMIAKSRCRRERRRDPNLSPAVCQKVIDINLMGAVNAVHAVLPKMLEQGHGQLVAISSLAGIRGLPKWARIGEQSGDDSIF